MTKTPGDNDAADPEKLIGPLLHLFTQLARHDDAQLCHTLHAQLLALARHPGVELDLRLAAGALAFEPEQLFAKTR